MVLYDLARDVSETTNVAEADPDVDRRLNKLGEKMRQDLGDDLYGSKRQNIRPPGFMENAKPLTRKRG